MNDPIQLRLRQRNVVPPAGFRFFCAETGKWSRTEHNSMSSCLREATEFYRANNFPIPQDFERHIEQQLCEKLGPDWCQGFDPGKPLLYGTALTFDAVKQGGANLTHMAARAIRQGRRAIVDDAEVQRRAKICATADPTFGRCRFNQNPTGNCPTCGGVKQVLDNLLRRVSTSLAGCPDTPYDAKLGACTVCLCPLRSKICIPKDILLEHMPQGQQEKLPLWCWLKEP